MEAVDSIEDHKVRFQEYVNEVLGKEEEKQQNSKLIARSKYERIKNYLEEKDCDFTDKLSGARSNAKFRSWVRSKGFLLKHDEHFEVFATVDGKDIPVIPAESAYDVIDKVHKEFGHDNSKRPTWRKILSSYYGITRDVVDKFVEFCPLCREFKLCPDKEQRRFALREKMKEIVEKTVVTIKDENMQRLENLKKEQTVLNFSIRGDFYDRWIQIGSEQGLTADTDIANFLIQHYDDSLNKIHPAAVCVNCHAPLSVSLLCGKCEATSLKSIETKCILPDSSQYKAIPKTVGHKTRKSLNKTKVAVKVPPVMTMITRAKAAAPKAKPKPMKSTRKKMKSAQKKSKTCQTLTTIKCSSPKITLTTVKQTALKALAEGNHTTTTPVKQSAASLSSQAKPTSVTKTATSINTEPIPNQPLLPLPLDQQSEISLPFNQMDLIPCGEDCITNSKPEVFSQQNISDSLSQVTGKNEGGDNDLIHLTVTDLSKFSHVDYRLNNTNGVEANSSKQLETIDSSQLCLLNQSENMNFPGEYNFGTATVEEITFSTHDLKQDVQENKQVWEIEARFLVDDETEILVVKPEPLVEELVPSTVRRRSVAKKPQICEFCGKDLLTPSALARHKMSHTDERPYKCEQCEKAFRKRAALIVHTRQHTGERPFNCDQCQKTFLSYSTLAVHKRVHSGIRPFKCRVCLKTFSRVSHLAAHMRIHVGLKPYKCPECERNFTESHHLTKHLRTHTGERPYACKICKKTFSQTSTLTAHLRVHSGEKPYLCSDCGKSFTDSSGLARHRRRHTGQKPYVCHQCGKAFYHVANLRQHMRIHTGERPYICDQCGESFVWKLNWKKHMDKHSGIIYKCGECGKSFNQAHYLSRHMKVHTGLKPHICDHCGKSFAEMSQLKAHVRIHTGERPYTCQVCGKTFRQQSGLSAHLRIHLGERPYPCKFCTKAFTESGALHRHMRIHTGDKPHVCKQCGRAFTASDALSKHMRLHSGLKPYTCEHCNQAFTWWHQWKKHIQTNHAIGLV